MTAPTWSRELFASWPSQSKPGNVLKVIAKINDIDGYNYDG